MQQRTVFGWLLALGFCASVSCGGGKNSSTPQGFGVPCTTAAACDIYKLHCGPDDTCVECRGDGDCDSKQICDDGLCITQDKCDDSRDCAQDQVCDDDAGVCVECVTLRDCKPGQACVDNSCEDRPACEFTSNCDSGLVCDMDLHACVKCRDDSDCSAARACEDYECVLPTPVGSSGSGSGGKGSGTAGTANGGRGGSGTAGSGTAGTFTGGTSSGGMSGSGGTSAGGEGPVDCGCPLNQVCTPDEVCVSPNLIDDLADCDNQILQIDGRQGDWAAGADTGINLMHGFTDPGTGWIDHTCAAWAAGGELTLNDPNATFAFIGFRLNVDGLDEGLAYDLTPYSGLQVKLESDSSVQVVLKTTGGGYFQVTLAPIAGSNVRSAPFSSMLKMANSLETVLNRSTVYEVQFSVTNPRTFGLAVHSVAFY